MYGIWDGVNKRFVFGIKEEKRIDAERKFIKLGEISYCWRYEVKTIPAGWKNPPNPVKYR